MLPPPDNVVTGLLYWSAACAVISEVDVPFAAILCGFAEFINFTAEPAVVLRTTVPLVSPDDTEVTTAVPEFTVDFIITVDFPMIAFFLVVPKSAPSPATLNVTWFVAFVTSVLSLYIMLAVKSEVAAPFAMIDTELAVFVSFTGTAVVITFTVPAIRFVPVEVTVTVPGFKVDLIAIVAIPPTAVFVVFPISVPSPLTENSRLLYASPTSTFVSSVILEVIVE